MKKVFLFGLLLALLVLVATGCGSTATSPTTETVTVAQVVTQTVTAATPAAVAPAPFNLSGTGSTTTQKFHLTAGLQRFAFTHTGESNFVVYLMDSTGKKLDLIANVVGSTNSSKAINVKSDGDYLLDIEADGAWTVAISAG